MVKIVDAQAQDADLLASLFRSPKVVVIGMTDSQSSQGSQSIIIVGHGRTGATLLLVVVSHLQDAFSPASLYTSKRSVGTATNCVPIPVKPSSTSYIE